MSRILMVGYGNSLRGDDALGPMVVERMRPLLGSAKLVSCHQLAPELSEELSHCELAIFVDATAQGLPGTVRVQRLTPETDGSASLTHHAAPSTLLALALELYGRVPQSILLTGAGAHFDAGDPFSEAAAEALHEICRLIPLLIRDFVVSP